MPADTEKPTVELEPIFGRYQILDRIAVGGMAEILLARSASLSGLTRTCVIKRILPNCTSDPNFVNMFIDEARITIGLHHPNIVKMYEFGQCQGTYYMAMEYVDGTDLASLCGTYFSKGMVFPVGAAVYIAGCLCQGLDHAHGKIDSKGHPIGIVHRDVSPHNVLISQQGGIKLTDFGIAAARNKLSHTVPGTVMGKVAYMSPEQVTGRPVNRRTDIWAVGVVLHEVLSGRRLFAANTAAATIQRVAGHKIEPPSTYNSAVTQDLDGIVMKALQRDVTERYQTAAELTGDLAWYLDKNPYGANELAELLQQSKWEQETSPMRPVCITNRSVSEILDATVPFPHMRIKDNTIQRLFDSFTTAPDLWTLVALGERYAELGEIDIGLSAIRTAALVFAYQGLLVQTIAAYNSSHPYLEPATRREDLALIASIEAGDRKALERALAQQDNHGFWALLQTIDTGLGDDEDVLLTETTPLLAALGDSEFVEFAETVLVHNVAGNSPVIKEGDYSESLFAVGRGRLVVHCAPGAQDEMAELFADSEDATERALPRPATDELFEQPDRIYLGAFADGDFFGEFSFLTRRPRSATVETVTRCVLLEIKRDMVERLFERDLESSAPLVDFYKERVVDLLMAKSPLFSLLDPYDRHKLLQKATIEERLDQDDIVQEGDQHDAFYFIKAGEVEVFHHDDRGVPIFINKLSSGQFFGEIAALTGVPRTVNVRAMGDVTLLRIPSEGLQEILDKQPRLRERFQATIESRQEQIKDRVREFNSLFTV